MKALLTRHSGTIRWVSLGLILVALLLLVRALPTQRFAALAQSWIDGLGVWGPVILGLLYVAAVLLLIPGSVLTLAAGALYGLVLGTIVVWISATTAAALAYLIARHLARDQVRSRIEQSPKLAAIDKAIGDEGWKIVALLRLSPAVPFNLQNYLYGVTAINFLPCIATTWVAMLPGTFMYVYIGSLGKAAASGRGTTPAEWSLRAVGLFATVVVTVYVARLARKAIQQRTDIQSSEESAGADENVAPKPAESLESQWPWGADENVAPRPAESLEPQWPWGAFLTAACAVLLVAVSVWANVRQQFVRQYVERLLGVPPAVVSVESYEVKPDGPRFDHSLLDAILRAHVDADGWVDYQGVRNDGARLDEYITSVATAPFDELGRNEKLALLINAYNAFTLRLILDHPSVKSIRDIPRDQRWDDPRWKVGSHTWSLRQIEQEQIRPHFVEPRIHFAVVCAAIGCPPLRSEAYTADKLDEQLAEQARYVHSHPQRYRFEAENNVVRLTKLYLWYGGDFVQHSGSIVAYAAQFDEKLSQALSAGRTPQVRWLDYDWRLNSHDNKPSE